MLNTTRVASEPSATNASSSAVNMNLSLLTSAENDLESARLSLTYPSMRSSGRGIFFLPDSEPAGITTSRSQKNGGYFKWGKFARSGVAEATFFSSTNISNRSQFEKIEEFLPGPLRV